MRIYLLLLSYFLVHVNIQAQSTRQLADSIRKTFGIPELAYAVISSDSVFVKEISGVQRINSHYIAKTTDRFHIGSNTKAVTSFIAAELVQDGKVKWDTKFLDLFPELKIGSRRVYENITLENLLTFRAKLPSYSYNFTKPHKRQIRGNDSEQRYELARYFLSRSPTKEQNGLTPSNADYILAGLLLEKASGKSYKQLVENLGNEYDIHFGFDYPNLTDSLQPWGHDASLKPLPPSKSYKLNWLLSAGNLNVNLDNYLNFMQLQLKGLEGKTTPLPKQVFENLLFGKPYFAFGWFNRTDIITNNHIAYNEGNAGAFITSVMIVQEAGKAYIIFTNSATEATSDGVKILMNYLQEKYK